MAVTVDLLLAVRTHPNTYPTIRIANVQSTKFERREFELPKHGDPEIDHMTHKWSNYFTKASNRRIAKALEGESWIKRCLEGEVKIQISTYPPEFTPTACSETTMANSVNSLLPKVLSLRYWPS